MTLAHATKPKTINNRAMSSRTKFTRKHGGLERKINQQNTLANSISQVRSPMIQAKPKIGESNDRYEQEADRVADMVMRMPDPVAGNHVKPVYSRPGNQIQRMCSDCEEELQRKPITEKSNFLQAKETPGSVPTVTSKVESQINGLKGGGQRLPQSVQNFFEPRFGYDFSDVRIHTDSTAARSAEALLARAYTNKNDIVFGKGQYQVNNLSGQRLLAHELTHVAQQTRSRITSSSKENDKISTLNSDELNNRTPVFETFNSRKYISSNSQGNFIQRQIIHDCDEISSVDQNVHRILVENSSVDFNLQNQFSLEVYHMLWNFYKAKNFNFTYGHDAAYWANAAMSTLRRIDQEFERCAQRYQEGRGIPLNYADEVESILEGLGILAPQLNNTEILDQLDDQMPSNSRTGRSAEETLQRFSHRVPDIIEFNDLASSYGLHPNQLLAVFMTEGGFDDFNRNRPEHRLSAAGLVSYYLWVMYGMDDFAVLGPRVQGDNTFGWGREDAAYRSKIERSLIEFYRLGLLWNEQGERPEDPRQQLTPDEILTQLISQMDVSRQVPRDDFPLFAIRIQAAMFARRQGLIGRSVDVLMDLGFSSDVANEFGYGGFAREMAAVIGPEGDPRTMESADRLLDDPDYRHFIQSSYDQRVSVELARISMGTPNFFRSRLERANRDFAYWASPSNQSLREQLYNWATSNSHVAYEGDETVLRILQESVESEDLSEIRPYINELRQRRYRDHIRQNISYIISSYHEYESVDSVSKWLSAALEEAPSRRILPISIRNIIKPTPINLTDARGGHLRAFANYLLWAQRVLDARDQIDNSQR